MFLTQLLNFKIHILTKSADCMILKILELQLLNEKSYTWRLLNNDQEEIFLKDHSCSTYHIHRLVTLINLLVVQIENTNWIMPSMTFQKDLFLVMINQSIVSREAFSLRNGSSYSVIQSRAFNDHAIRSCVLSVLRR